MRPTRRRVSSIERPNPCLTETIAVRCPRPRRGEADETGSSGAGQAAAGEDGRMAPSPKIYVKACINGARTPDQHPNLPVTPDQLAAEALAAHQAGAKAVHMHPKTADGVDSLQPDVVDAAVSAVRHAVPGLPLGVTTGYWALPDADARLRAVEAWSVLPDFASVNWHEPGAEELAELLLSRGVGVEAGIFHAEAAASWAASEMRRTACG